SPATATGSPASATGSPATATGGTPTRRVFLVHGDPDAQAALAPKVQALGLDVHVPAWHERVSLD
ncbi:MAG TPA: MBL fold metallo-hydrolase RNA specificity domain-containing protein, partial [Candidatus Limnocylindrales bacterium]|nr:MBL fold metallo-hydrolase RNA specificity domain-containing protein [Candidatus Limnocylindrales bacterium]